ncbi:MAG: hypothetical protein ABR529_07615 [Actinomycetota bacterium]
MRDSREVQRYVEDESDLYIEFVDDLKEPLGSVNMRAEQADDRVICRAEWGGWSWRAEGPDRMTAQRRLSDRLSRLDPFDHSDADWGGPGFQVSELDEAIPPATRQRMRDYTQREARSAVGLLEAVFEAQARRPWAFPEEGAPVRAGVEIEGYVGMDGSLALFPRTFYEIANAYFGRAAARGGHAEADAPSPEPDAHHDHPGLAGALRRLNEKGYMRATEGQLPHQIRPIQVYVFTADPERSSLFGRPLERVRAAV